MNMSEKRFELLLPNAIINDTIVRKSYYFSEKDDVEKLVDELNELSEENEQLRKELNDCEKFRYQVFKRIGELNDE